MKDLSYFILRSFYYAEEKSQTVFVKIEDIEKIWFCSKKNVTRKLKQLEAQEKLTYIPGRGRGNKSSLLFSHPFQKEVELFTSNCIRDNQLDDLVQLLQLPIPKPWIAAVSNEVRELFGMQETDENKDVLRSIISRDMTTLDPVNCSVTFESHLIRQIGDTLVIYNSETDEIEPHLAHHWKVNEDYTVWKFYLHKGVRFHHQSLLTSEDVKYTFERFHPNTAYYWLVEDIEKIDCLTPYTIQIKLTKPNPFFLRYVSTCNLVILPQDIPFDEFQWIGTGPFHLKRRDKQRIVIEAHDHYFLARPFLDRIEFWKIPMETAKTVSYTINSNETLKTGILKKDVEVGFRFLAFNFNRNSVVHDKLFREAVFHILNVQKLCKELGRDPVKDASSFFPWNSIAPHKDLNKVTNLLKQSNYNGETLSLYCLNFPGAIEEATWFKQEASKFGMTFELQTFSLEEFYTNKLEKGADLLFMGEVSAIDYHLSFLGAFYNKMLIFRRFLGKDNLLAIEQLLENFKQIPLKNKRDEIIEQVEAIIKENNLFIFMHHPIKNRVFHPMIQDIQLESFGQVDFRKLWIK
ncbi:SgrR family transcriptional regulator [Aquibacillus kalidii]|uniref:SgrR family transcriptional regulator n=1 Tax=Aquibacillus kalidii TaxID=2762597 RepID=UPI0016449BC9|nr:SgrR family transcriptional regulator [Aquibacillus kalidii]